MGNYFIIQIVRDIQDLMVKIRKQNSKVILLPKIILTLIIVMLKMGLRKIKTQIMHLLI
jgi:hypothetical protein